LLRKKELEPELSLVLAHAGAEVMRAQKKVSLSFGDFTQSLVSALLRNTEPLGSLRHERAALKFGCGHAGENPET